MAEKYTQWADKSCGVNPFVPGEIALPKSTLVRMGRYVIGSLLALPRLAIAIALVSLYLVAQVVLNEFFLSLVSLVLSWLCNTGKIDAQYFIPLAVLTLISFLSVSYITAVISCYRTFVDIFFSSFIL